ncbi:MAG: patatin-like phospholipase family protein [Planctomycetota bacterium]
MSELRTNPADHSTTPLGLMLGGGGARAAYQVGVLRALARACPDLSISRLNGVSAGSINIAYLANQSARFQDAVEGLARLWTSLDMSRVIETGLPSLLARMFGAAVDLSIGTGPHVGGARSMVDNRPLREFLARALEVGADGELMGVQRNLEAGRFDGVGITTFCFTTGRTVTFFAGERIRPWARPRRDSERTKLRLDHVLASSALPLLFPAVPIGARWFGDGGIRLVAPLGPILHMGSERILVISTHFTGDDSVCSVATREPPSPALILASLYNHIFNDELDQDVRHFERVNELLPHVGDGYRKGLREVQLLVIRPSEDLGRLAREHERQLPHSLRFFLRRFGSGQSRSHDFLSTLMFDPGYLARLMEIGEADGESRLAELTAFVGK